MRNVSEKDKKIITQDNLTTPYNLKNFLSFKSLKIAQTIMTNNLGKKKGDNVVGYTINIIVEKGKGKILNIDLLFKMKSSYKTKERERIYLKPLYDIKREECSKGYSIKTLQNPPFRI